MGYSRHELSTVRMLYSKNCPVTPLPPHNSHLSTTATFFSPQGGRCGGVRLYFHSCNFHHRVIYELTMACSPVGLISSMDWALRRSGCDSRSGLKFFFFFRLFFNRLDCSFNCEDHVHFPQFKIWFISRFFQFILSHCLLVLLFKKNFTLFGANCLVTSNHSESVKTARSAFASCLAKPEKTADVSWRHHRCPRGMMSEKRAQKFNTDDASQPRSLKPHVLICRFFRSVLAFENAPYFAFRVLLLLYHLIAEYLSGSLFRRNGAVILSLKIGISMRMCKVLPDTSNFFFVIAHE